jgi:hypothetical protein
MDSWVFLLVCSQMVSSWLVFLTILSSSILCTCFNPFNLYIYIYIMCRLICLSQDRAQLWDLWQFYHGFHKMRGISWIVDGLLVKTFDPSC